MKTFDEKDLITWSNREKAVIGNEYYFADSLIGMKSCINNNCSIYTLNYIAEENICAPFHCKDLEGNLSYACILPVDAVKEEKKYRACKTITEFSDVIDLSSLDSYDDSDYIYDLIDKTIHIRSKNTGTEYYTSIRSISADADGCVKILMTSKSYLSFEQIFSNYEIEINGKWCPFGVSEK